MLNVLHVIKQGVRLYVMDVLRKVMVKRLTTLFHYPKEAVTINQTLVSDQKVRIVASAETLITV